MRLAGLAGPRPDQDWKLTFQNDHFVFIENVCFCQTICVVKINGIGYSGKTWKLYDVYTNRFKLN
jgi:hypothetical protein